MKEQRHKEKNPVYQVVRPYIYEGTVACVLDYILFQFPSLLMLIFYGNEPKLMQICVLVCLGISTVIAAVFDAPLLIKSLRDKKNQTICVATGVFICVKEDKSQSNQFTRYGTRSIYAASYYPKEWNMERYRFLLRTQEGEVLKLRSIYSWSHDQALFLQNVLHIQEKATRPFLLRIRYCRYSKALLDIQVVDYPAELKRRTLEYVMNGFRNITRWTIKKC